MHETPAGTAGGGGSLPPAKAIVDLAAGTCAGATQLLVGHPFDSVKVIMQTQVAGQQTGAIQAARQALAAGPLELYKGMGSPLATVAAFNALLFSVWGATERFLLGPEGGHMTPAQATLAGCVAGFPVSLLATPTELLKCRLQQQAGKRPALGQVFNAADYRAGRVLFRGPIDVLRQAIRYEGLLSVFRGLGPTLLREVPGNGAYFGVYELLKQGFARSQGLASTADLGPGSLMVAGGAGGAAFWAFVYPTDVIKTRLQTQNPFNPSYSGVLDCARKIVAAQGWRGLYVGFGPCIARSVPANAVAFLTFEGVRSRLSH